MKKVLLFLLCALVSIGTRAAETSFGTSSSYEIADGVFTITIGSTGDYGDWIDNGYGKIQRELCKNNSVKKVVFKTGTGVTILQDCSGNGYNKWYWLGDAQGIYPEFKTVDFSNSVFEKYPVTFNLNNYGFNFIVPGDCDVDKFISDGKHNYMKVSGETVTAVINNAGLLDWGSIRGNATTLILMSDVSAVLDLSASGFTTFNLTNVNVTADITVPSGSTVLVKSEEEKSKVKGTNVTVTVSKPVAPVDEKTLSVTAAEFKDRFVTNGEEIPTGKENLVITEGDIDDIFANIATLCAGFKKVDLTNATLSDNVRLDESTIVDWEILILPTGTKISPNFKCYPKLKFAMGGGFEKIWLVSHYDGKNANTLLKNSGIDNLLPSGITEKPTGTRRIGVAFVGLVTVDDISYFVHKDNGKLKHARIWHLGAADGLYESDIKTIGSFMPGNNNLQTVTGLVLPRGFNIENSYNQIEQKRNVGNVYCLSKDDDGLTMTARLTNTGTFDIARFTVTNTKRVVLISDGEKYNITKDDGTSEEHFYGEMDDHILAALRNTKRAVTADLSHMIFPDGTDNIFKIKDEDKDKPIGTIRRLLIPAGLSFTPENYDGTSFGVIARIKTDEDLAVVYQRVPGTLAYTAAYRSQTIKEKTRIRYRGYASEYDLGHLFSGNTNLYYDLSDLKIVKYKNEEYMTNPPIKYDATLVEENKNPNMAVISNSTVEYIALPAGTKIPDDWKLGFNEEYEAKKPETCGSLRAVGVLNTEKGKDTDVDQERNTISIYSYEGGSTAPVVDMLTDATDFPTISTQSNDAKQNSSDMQSADNTESTESTDNATNTTNVPVRHLVMGGKLFFCDIADGDSYVNGETGHYNTAKKSITAASEAEPAALAEESVNGIESNAKYNAAFNGHTGIFDFTDADLTNALFADTKEHSEDLTLSDANSFDNCTEIWLPVDHRQTTIPKDAFNNAFGNLTSLCIPGNIKTIKEGAFLLCTMQEPCITTTGVDENGDGFYVDKDGKSAIIDNGPRTVTLPEGLETIETEAFHFNAKITDVYALATKAPKCAKNAFTSMSYTGNNSFFGTPVRRDSYVDPDKTNSYAVLHYPARTTKEEAMNYTDITRRYSLPDNTGDMDGNGNLKMWPAQSDWNLASVLAVTGYTWDALDKYKNEWNYNKLPFDKEGHLTTDFKNALNADAESHKYKSEEYMGWHQFVLVNTVYMADPTEKRMNASRFKRNDWYSICIPYELRKSDLLNIFGAKAGEDDKVTIDGKEYTGDRYPDVCTLVSVKRDNTKRLVTLTMSRDLVKTDFTMNDNRTKAVYSNYEEEDPVVIKAGFPYLIRPYLPADELEKANAGTRVVGIKTGVGRAAEVIFPDITHTVTATDENNNVLDKEGDNKWIYQFVGHYYADKVIPDYAYFLGLSKSKGQNIWFYNPGGESTAKIAWPQYVAVIAANARCETYTPTDKEAEIDGKTPSITFDNAQSDDIVISGNAKYQMVFDTGDTETTGISDIDANKAEDSSHADGKVYSISGQYVGDSLSGLSKGIYIVNGKKYVVE